MARPTVLTDVQKAQIITLAAQNLTPYAIGKKMGLPPTTVSRHMASAEKCKKAASAIVRIEKEISTYTIPEQSATMDLLSGLRSISRNLIQAAVIGSENSVRIHSIAKLQLDKATGDPENPDVEALAKVGGLTKMANDASALGMQLVAANKDQMQSAPEVPKIDASKLSDAALAELMDARDAAEQD